MRGVRDLLPGVVHPRPVRQSRATAQAEGNSERYMKTTTDLQKEIMTESLSKIRRVLTGLYGPHLIVYS